MATRSASARSDHPPPRARAACPLARRARGVAFACSSLCRRRHVTPSGWAGARTRTTTPPLTSTLTRTLIRTLTRTLTRNLTRPLARTLTRPSLTRTLTRALTRPLTVSRCEDEDVPSQTCAWRGVRSDLIEVQLDREVRGRATLYLLWLYSLWRYSLWRYSRWRYSLMRYSLWRYVLR